MATRQARKTPRRRSAVSITLAVSASVLLLTGLLSLVLPYHIDLAGLHSWFGLLFAIAIGLHISNNGRSLLHYLRAAGGKRQLYSALGAAVLVLVGVLLALPPFSSLLEFSYKLKRTEAVEQGSYQTISTRIDAFGTALSTGLNIELRAGRHYQSPPQPLFLGLSYRSTPQIAIWTEDLAGNYLQTLYLTSKVASSNFRLASLSNSERQRRPESLPVWSHRRGVRSADGLMVPLTQQADLDGVTAATPLGHYDVRTVAQSGNAPYKLMLEVNRSYDFNDYYSPDRFPEDPVYSGSGSSGQPSIVYSSVITPSERRQHSLLAVIGHGHHSGQDGNIYEDMIGIDSALELLDRVVVAVEPRSQQLAALEPRNE